MKFEYNSFGVCTNPERVFHVTKKGALAWDYAEIQISESDGNWFWGHSCGGGGGPCSIVGKKYPTREDAIEDAYQHLFKYLTRESLDTSQPFTKNAGYHLMELISWHGARKQYSLF